MDLDAYRAHLGLKPLPHTTPPEAPKPGVRLNQHVDRSRTDSLELRGIPAVGHGVTGAIPGTRPGDTTPGHDLRSALMRQARTNLPRNPMNRAQRRAAKRDGHDMRITHLPGTTSIHTIEIIKRERGYFAGCSCGWRSIAYPESKKERAQLAAEAHAKAIPGRKP